jgi:NAD(P)-dependent dehydrogenase (short-subunit alcohol dehydrogenase family)
MIERNVGGCLIATSSGAGLIGTPNLAHYVAAKHGLQGLVKTLANELGIHNIRVNTVNPTNVKTDMIMNDMTYRLFRPDLEHPGPDDVVDAAASAHPLHIPWVEPVDISNAMVFLASDEARYITGLTLAVDAGITIKV